jgi:hypothetical protein
VGKGKKSVQKPKDIKNKSIIEEKGDNMDVQSNMDIDNDIYLNSSSNLSMDLDHTEEIEKSKKNIKDLGVVKKEVVIEVKVAEEKKKKNLIDTDSDHAYALLLATEGGGRRSTRSILSTTGVKEDDVGTKKGTTIKLKDDSDNESVYEYSPINNRTNIMKFIGSKYMHCESVPVVIVKVDNEGMNFLTSIERYIIIFICICI